MDLTALSTQAMEIVAAWGPFPFGILMGFVMTRHIDLTLIKYAERENNALRQEKKDLMAMLDVKDKRIEALHNEIYLVN